MNGLTTSKATGLDSLPARFLKDGAEVFACPLVHIINLSSYSSQILEDMKNARVVPLYKKQSKIEPGNYRPVPILSVTSKILKRIVYNQLEHYLKENNLLYNRQSGFRPSFSTGTCLTFLMDYIRSEMNFGNYIRMVMIDLQKAFDTVDHSILEHKLKAIVLDRNAIAWFDAYLTNRMQVTDVGGIFSNPRVVPWGVPQGSILGLLLFLIYVIDMEASVSCKLILYADDSALLVSGKHIKTIENVLGDNFLSLSNWLIDNKLSLHLGKAESTLFGTKHMLSKHSKLAISCGNNVITSKTVIRYLGVDLEQTLSGTAIVENI